MLNNNILRPKNVAQYVQLSKSHIYRLVSLGQFPKPIKLGERASGWILSDVDNWIQQRRLAH